MNISIYKKILKEKKMTYADLAEITGLSLGCIKRIMAGIAQYPRIDTIESIEKALGISNEWTAEERAQGVIDHKKISVSADEETLIECYRTIGRKFGKKKQENFIKLAELYAEEED